MYELHFGFKERPFQLSPDPAFLYFSRKHGIALSLLEYGLQSDAPIILTTGEIGAGKTTLVRYLLGRIEKSTTVGLITNTHSAFGDLLQWVSSAFGLPIEGKSKSTLYTEFTDFIVREYAAGRRTLLIIDEAQNMSAQTLEELRVLTNINADKHVVLQLLLIGQPELRDTLRKPNLEQFAQRIAVDYHLAALDLKETREYIQHRLTLAGGSKAIFLPDAVIGVFQHSGGIPRLINSLCDMALVYTFAEGRSRVSGKMVHEIVAEREAKGLFGGGKRNSRDFETGRSDGHVTPNVSLDRAD